MDKTCGTCGHCRNTHDGPYCYKSGYPRPVSPIRVMDCWVDPADVEKEPQATKVCSHCGRELPVENFGRHSRTKDGYQPCCKECQSEMNKGHKKRKPFEHNEAPSKPEEPEQVPEGMKKCCHCGRILPVTEFRKRSRAKDGLQSACKECQVEMTTAAKQKKTKKRKEVIREAQKEILKEKLLKADPEIMAEVMEDAEKDFAPVPAAPGITLEYATDQQLVDELKRRGYQGNLIRKTSFIL